jgi:hypothetical protein
MSEPIDALHTPDAINHLDYLDYLVESGEISADEANCILLDMDPDEEDPSCQ